MWSASIKSASFFRQPYVVDHPGIHMRPDHRAGVARSDKREEEEGPSSDAGLGKKGGGTCQVTAL